MSEENCPSQCSYGLQRFQCSLPMNHGGLCIDEDEGFTWGHIE